MDTKLRPHRGLKDFFMVNYFTLFSLYGPLLEQVIPKFCKFHSICDGYRDKPPLSVFKVKGHRVTDLHFFRYMALIRASDPKKSCFAPPAMITKISMHFLFSRSKVIRASDPNILSVSLYLRFPSVSLYL